MDWLKELRHQAKEKGMCVEYRTPLHSLQDRASAVALYKQDLTWAMKSDFPTLACLRMGFADMQSKGLFIDHCFQGEVLSEHQVYALHNCKGFVKVALNLEKRLNPIIYVANGCDIVVEGVAINSPKPTVYTINSYGENVVKTVGGVDMVEYNVKQYDTDEA